MATLLLNSFTYPFSIKVEMDCDKDGHIYELIEFYIGICADVQEKLDTINGQRELTWYFTDVSMFKMSLDRVLKHIKFDSITQQAI